MSKSNYIIDKNIKTEYIIERFNGGMHYIKIDNSIVDLFKNKGENRAVCKLNGQIEFHCAFMPKKEGGYFVNIGAKICKKLNIKEGSTLTAIFKADKSEYQFEMPEEFSEVLKQDLGAHAIFQNLTDGNKRGLIYLVAQVKSTDKRIERALLVAERLKKGITSPRIILK